MDIILFLLSKFFQQEVWNTIFMILASICINVLQTNAISYITANIINSIQKNAKVLSYTFLKYFIIVSVGFLVLYHFYKIFQNKLLTKMRQWIRFQLIRMLLLVNNDNFSSINFSKLSSPINRLSSVCFMVFNDLITYLLPNIIFLLIISIYFTYNNLTFGGIFIAGNILMLIYLALNWSSMKDKNELYEQQVNDTEAYLVEILYNIDKIVYRGQVENETDIFYEKTNKGIDRAYGFYSTTNNVCSVMNSFVYCTMFGCAGYLVHLYYLKKMPLTIFITFFTILLLYRDKMSSAIQQIPDFIEFMGRSEGVVTLFKSVSDNYEELLEKQKNGPGFGDSIEGKHGDSAKPNLLNLPFERIQFDKVSFQYESADNVLFTDMNVDLKTSGNKIIGITGLSGNGKSTIAKMILKMYQTKTGAVYIDGVDVKEMDADYIRKNITYVNQNSKLFDKKIIDNMMYGCTNEESCRIHLDEILVYPKVKQLYQNLDIMTASSGALGEKLSGGQRQVVNMIGGLINPSKILILDEPTNALDPELKKEILDIIRHFKKYKQCILIITHDQDVHELFDEHIQV